MDHLGAPQAQIQQWVQAAAGREHQAVGVLTIQHQLCRHQVHLQWDTVLNNRH